MPSQIKQSLLLVCRDHFLLFEISFFFLYRTWFVTFMLLDSCLYQLTSIFRPCCRGYVFTGTTNRPLKSIKIACGVRVFFIYRVKPQTFQFTQNWSCLFLTTVQGINGWVIYIYHYHRRFNLSCTHVSDQFWSLRSTTQGWSASWYLLIERVGAFAS